jgi:hypothetical protein
MFICNGYKIAFFSFETLDCVGAMISYSNPKQWRNKNFFINQGGKNDLLIDIWRMSLSNPLLKENMSFNSAMESFIEAIMIKISSQNTVQENIYFIKELLFSFHWCCSLPNKSVMIPYFISLVDKLFNYFIEKKRDSIDIIIQFVNRSKETYDKLVRDTYQNTIINQELEVPSGQFKHLWLSIGQKLFELSSSKLDHFLEINADEIDIDEIDSDFSDDTDDSVRSDEMETKYKTEIPYKELLESLLFILTKDENERLLCSKDYYQSFNLETKKLLKLKKGNMYFLSGNFLKAASSYERYLKRPFFSRAAFLSYIHAGEIDEAFKLFSTYILTFNLEDLVPNYQFIHVHLVEQLAICLEHIYEGNALYGLSAPACYDLSLPMFISEPNPSLYLALDIEKLRKSCFTMIQKRGILNVLNLIVSLWFIAGKPSEAIRICIKFNLWHKSLEVYLKISEMENSNEIMNSNELREVFTEVTSNCKSTESHKLNRILSIAEMYNETVSTEIKSLIMDRYLVEIKKELIKMASNEKLVDCSRSDAPQKFMPKMLTHLKFLNPNTQPTSADDLLSLLFNCVRIFTDDPMDFKNHLKEYRETFEKKLSRNQMCSTFRVLCRYLFFIYLKDSIQSLFFNSKPFKRYYSMNLEEENKNDCLEITKKFGYFLSFREFYSVDYLQGIFLTSLTSLSSEEEMIKYLVKYFPNENMISDSHRPQLNVIKEMMNLKDEFSTIPEVNCEEGWEFELESDYWDYLVLLFDSMKLFKVQNDIDSLLTSIKAIRDPSDQFIPKMSEIEFQQKLNQEKKPYMMLGLDPNATVPRLKSVDSYSNDEISFENEIRIEKKRETVNLTKLFFSNLLRANNNNISSRIDSPLSDDVVETTKKRNIFDMLSPRKNKIGFLFSPRKSDKIEKVEEKIPTIVHHSSFVIDLGSKDILMEEMIETPRNNSKKSTPEKVKTEKFLVKLETKPSSDMIVEI